MGYFFLFYWAGFHREKMTVGKVFMFHHQNRKHPSLLSGNLCWLSAHSKCGGGLVLPAMSLLFHLVIGNTSLGSSPAATLTQPLSPFQPLFSCPAAIFCSCHFFPCLEGVWGALFQQIFHVGKCAIRFLVEKSVEHFHFTAQDWKLLSADALEAVCFPLI